MRALFALIFLFVFSIPWAQAQMPKHPRAFQIEKGLQSELDQAIKNFLGDKPFLSFVKVDPLRRGISSAERTSLPLLDLKDSLTDEWDDPDRFDYELLTRVNRIHVKIVLPENISKFQVEEVKNLAKQRIPLVEGRDLVEVEQKELVANKAESSLYKWLGFLGGLLLIAFGVIHLMVNLVASNRLAKAVKSIKVDTSHSGSGVGNVPLASPQNNTPSANSSRQMGDVQLHDSLKMAELVQDLVKMLETKECFPVLEDMILLEEELRRHPQSVGALVNSFPPQLRDKVFSFSRSQLWFKSILEGGILDSKSFEIMNRLVKHKRDNESYLEQQLLMRCWRSQEQMSEFLRGIELEDSLSILHSLPRGMAIELGRNVVPGRWASLLETSSKEVKGLSEIKLHQYMKQIDKIIPLRDSKVLDKYKKDLELLQYLRSVDPVVEKEVYLATGEGSTLYDLRSPFYPVLEANESHLKNFVSTVTIEDWAYGLFNVPKVSRLMIEKCFSDRQKFMLVDLLKRLDRQGIDKDKVSEARDKIGLMWSGYIQTELVTSTYEKTSPLEVEGDKDAA